MIYLFQVYLDLLQTNNVCFIIEPWIGKYILSIPDVLVKVRLLFWYLLGSSVCVSLFGLLQFQYGTVLMLKGNSGRKT